MAIEKFSTLLPSIGQGKRIMKSKLLTALGATGVLAPYPQNPEHILERKILLQAPFNTSPVVPPPSGPSLLTGLMAYWKLDEAIPGPFADATGNGSPLALVTDGNMSSVAGIINNAVNSIGGGGSRYLWIADKAALSAGTGVSFSVSTWMLNNSPAFPGTFVSKCDNIVDVPGGNGEFRLFNATAIDNDQHWFIWDAAGTMHDVGTTSITNTVVFHHYVLTFDATSNTATSYVDGVFKSSIVIPSNPLRTAFPFNIMDANNSGRNAGGAVDETGYWHAVLSQALVTRLYNGGLALPFASFT